MGVPKIKKVLFQVVPESSSQFALLKAGTIDVAHDLLPNEIVQLKGASGVKTIVTPGHWLTHLVLNEKMVPQFANKLVRQALNYAIDRDKIVKVAYYGMAEPMKCVYPSDFPGALDPSAFPYDYNIAKAKQLMAQAGYAKGFSVELYYQADDATLESACLIIQAGMAQIGINASLRSTPLGTLETLYTGKKAPLALVRLYPFQPDANYDVGLMYATKGFCNYGYFSNKQIDDMITQGVSIVEPQKRYAFHKKIQQLILEEAPVGFVVQDGYWAAIRDNITGWNLDIAETTRYGDLTKG
jgi:peptide/nickel transport system substrate-binding protein